MLNKWILKIRNKVVFLKFLVCPQQISFEFSLQRELTEKNYFCKHIENLENLRKILPQKPLNKPQEKCREKITSLNVLRSTENASLNKTVLS